MGKFGAAAAALVCMAGLLAGTERSLAQTPVAVELVLAVDTSISVNPGEFKLITRGMAHAFRSEDVISLIELRGGIAVTLFQWASRAEEEISIPWTHLSNRSTILAFADLVENTRRGDTRGFTAIGNAIDHGVQLIANNRFRGDQRKIDISGDGFNNTGLPLDRAHRRAEALGIVINGLPILTDSPFLDRYFHDEVIHGPLAFVEVANSYEDFAQAFKRKLLREIGLIVSRDGTPSSSGDPAPTRMAMRAEAADGDRRTGDTR